MDVTFTVNKKQINIRSIKYVHQSTKKSHKSTQTWNCLLRQMFVRFGLGLETVHKLHVIFFVQCLQTH